MIHQVFHDRDCVTNFILAIANIDAIAGELSGDDCCQKPQTIALTHTVKQPSIVLANSTLKPKSHFSCGTVPESYRTFPTPSYSSIAEVARFNFILQIFLKI